MKSGWAFDVVHWMTDEEEDKLNKDLERVGQSLDVQVLFDRDSLQETLERAISGIPDIPLSLSDADDLVGRFLPDVKVRGGQALIREFMGKYFPGFPKGSMAAGGQAHYLWRIVLTRALQISPAVARTMAGTRSVGVPRSKFFVRGQCPQCGVVGWHEAQDPTAPRVRVFSCECGHNSRNCSCRLCAQKYGELLQILEWPLEMLNTRLPELVSDKGQHVSKIEDEDRILFELNKNNVPATLRKIINLKPSTAEQFFELCKKHAGNSDQWDSLAAKLGIVRQSTMFGEYCFRSSGRVSMDQFLARWDATAMSRQWLRKLGPEEPGDPKGLVCLEQWPSFRKNGAFIKIETPFLNQIELRTTGFVYSLNPYFFPNGESRPAPASCSPSAKTISLFRSKIEARAFARLKAECGCVCPDRLLRQVVDLNAIRADLDAKELAYLTSCIVDFVGYDDDGNVLWVEEVQKGPHHDEAEWIWKDAAKKKACALAGVAFRESF